MRPLYPESEHSAATPCLRTATAVRRRVIHQSLRFCVHPEARIERKRFIFSSDKLTKASEQADRKNLNNKRDQFSKNLR